MTATSRSVFVICTGESCVQAGAHVLLDELKHQCVRSQGEVRISAARCIGHCQIAPAAVKNGRVLGAVSRRRIRAELARLGHS